MDSDKGFATVGWVLTDNNHERSVNELLNAIAFVNDTGDEWDCAFNKSYLNITTERARCGDLYAEENFVDLNPNNLARLLKSWKIFITKKGDKRETVVII